MQSFEHKLKDYRAIAWGAPHRSQMCTTIRPRTRHQTAQLLLRLKSTTVVSVAGWTGSRIFGHSASACYRELCALLYAGPTGTPKSSTTRARRLSWSADAKVCAAAAARGAILACLICRLAACVHEQAMLCKLLCMLVTKAPRAGSNANNLPTMCCLPLSARSLLLPLQGQRMLQVPVVDMEAVVPVPPACSLTGLDAEPDIVPLKAPLAEPAIVPVQATRPVAAAPEPAGASVPAASPAAASAPAAAPPAAAEVSAAERPAGAGAPPAECEVARHAENSSTPVASDSSHLPVTCAQALERNSSTRARRLSYITNGVCAWRLLSV